MSAGETLGEPFYDKALRSIEVAITPDKKQVIVNFRLVVRGLLLDAEGAEKLAALLVEAAAAVRAAG